MSASATPAPRRRSPAPPTRAGTLAQHLADEIVAGRLMPGTPLEEIPLAAAHGVSRTPVREALRRLESSGLVETRPRRGAVVARPEPRRLREIFAVMAELAQDTRRRLAPFRAAQLDVPGRLHRSHEEHGAILTAILRGAGEEAARMMREHLALTEAAWGRMMDVVLGGTPSQPPFFWAEFPENGFHAYTVSR